MKYTATPASGQAPAGCRALAVDYSRRRCTDPFVSNLVEPTPMAER